jgi:alpha-tubulin suppressor-like RCC1 family protein
MLAARPGLGAVLCFVVLSALGCGKSGGAKDAGRPDLVMPPPPEAGAADVPAAVDAGPAWDAEPPSDVRLQCQAGALTCIGRNPASCDVDGGWVAAAPCAADAGGCSAGVCGSPAMIVAGGTHTCALRDDGTVRCWGDNTIGQLGFAGTPTVPAPTMPVPLPAKAVQISAFGLHACAALETGTVACWGENGAGQLGAGDKAVHTTPVGPIDLPGVLDVATGADHTCVRRVLGLVECWGANDRGQLGADVPDAGLDHQRLTFYMQEYEPWVLALAAGDQRTVAVTTGGDLYAWGTISDNVITGSAWPMRVNGAAVAIAAGGYQGCAVLDHGQLVCWGGAAVSSVSSSPFDQVRAVPLPGRAVAVAVGRAFTCVVLETGELSCWGDNYAGQLGLGDTKDRDTPSAPFSVGGRAVAVTAGYRHTCVRLDTGALKCWGDNSAGQLGLGDRRSRGGTADTVPAKLPEIAFP